MVQTIAFLPIIESRFFLSAPNTVLSKSSSDGNGSKLVAYKGKRMINAILPFWGFKQNPFPYQIQPRYSVLFIGLTKSIL